MAEIVRQKHYTVVHCAGVTSDGVGVIYDPGSFYGHHEYDLGIAGMFGFSSDFLAAYHELIPKAGEPGFENRDQLYKIGLPGKLIFSKRKGLREVLFP